MNWSLKDHLKSLKISRTQIKSQKTQSSRNLSLRKFMKISVPFQNTLIDTDRTLLKFQ